MTALRLGTADRLEVLAGAVLDYLDAAFSEGELDDDSNPPHTELYNLASAMADAARPLELSASASELRLRADHERHADELATMALEYADEPGRLALIRRRIVAGLEKALGGAIDPERTP